MQLISKYNKAIRFLLCAVNVVSKHEWAFALNEKK